MISGASNAIVGAVGVGNNPVGVAVSPTTSTVYVSNSLDGTISVCSQRGRQQRLDSV